MHPRNLGPWRSWRCVHSRSVGRLVLVLLAVAAACGDAGAPTARPETVATTSSTTASIPPEPAVTSPIAGAVPDSSTVDATTTIPLLPPLARLRLDPVAAGLHQPTFVGAGGGELIVAEREGRVVAVGVGGELRTVLDLFGSTLSAGIEQGLLGVAFHPDGRIFTYRTVAGGNRRLSEFAASDPGSEQVLWEVGQPGDEPRHYGGMLQFGPEGRLWVSVGDGAASRHGQDSATPYGTILRFDVDRGGEPDVWAYGLRNPWRFTLDDGLAYVADVGFETREEVNVVPAGERGHNFGWSIAEGDVCFSERDCDPAGEGLTAPVLTYGHDEGCSITGGVVYRGAAIPELAGHYFYADWCGQWVRSFRFAAGQVTDERDWSGDLPEAGQINALGAGPDGELYLVNFAGEVWKVVPER